MWYGKHQCCSVQYWWQLVVSDVEDCNICMHKRGGTVTDIEQGAVKLW